MSTAIPKAVLPPLLSWAIHDYIQFGDQKGLSRSWQASAKHLFRLLLLACDDIPVDAISRQEIDKFWHAFRYWPSGASRRQDLVGCTDGHILTIGFVEAKPAPSAILYAIAQRILRHFFAWLQKHGAIVRAPCELNAVIKHKPSVVPSGRRSKLQALVNEPRRTHRPLAGCNVVLQAWKRPDSSPLLGSKLRYCIDRFINARRVDGISVVRLRSYVSVLRVLFAALGDICLQSINDAHIARFWQLYQWLPQSSSREKIDMDALTDSQVLEIGKQRIASPPHPSLVVRAQEVIREFLDWTESEGAAALARVPVRGSTPKPPLAIS